MTKIKVGEPSEAEFERVSKKNMDTLLAWMDALDIENLSFAAEIAGKNAGILHSKKVCDKLLGFLKHNSAVVREGAILGLSHHLTTEVKNQLATISVSDPSDGCKRVAKEILSYGKRL